MCCAGDDSYVLTVQPGYDLALLVAVTITLNDILGAEDAWSATQSPDWRLLLGAEHIALKFKINDYAEDDALCQHLGTGFTSDNPSALSWIWLFVWIKFSLSDTNMR